MIVQPSFCDKNILSVLYGNRKIGQVYLNTDDKNLISCTTLNRGSIFIENDVCDNKLNLIFFFENRKIGQAIFYYVKNHDDFSINFCQKDFLFPAGLHHLSNFLDYHEAIEYLSSLEDFSEWLIWNQI